ncbi:MAG: hypothetical protein ABIR30_08415 [Chitinophagaceae bacterium]
MRKLSVILLTGLFIFSQYARHLGFLGCEFSKIFNPGAAQCDCVKKAGLDKQDSNPTPVSTTHTHIHPDDFFSHLENIAPDPFFKDLHSLFSRDQTPGALAGNFPAPWEPPNC